jgi:hypothetical protein
MRTAQCAITLDTSKFDGPLERSKAKLASFAAGVADVARKTKSAIDTAAQLSQSFLTTRDAVKTLANDIINYRQRLDKLREVYAKLKEAGATLLGGLKGISPEFRKNATAALAVGAGAVIAYKSIKTLGVAMVDTANKAGKTLTSSLTKASSALSSAFDKAKYGALALVGAVTALAGGTAAGVFQVFNLGDSLKTLRDRTGASIPFLMSLQKAFQQAGISAEAVGPMLANMQRSLTGINADGEPTNKMFERLKLNVSELLQLSPEQQFSEIQKAISNLASPAERTAAAFGIFGRQGAALTAVFADTGTLDKIGKKLEGRAKILQENADIFAAISVKLRESGSIFTGFFTAVAGRVGRPLLAILEKFEGADRFSAIGDKVGAALEKAVTTLYNAIESGRLFEVLKSIIQQVFSFVTPAMPSVAGVIAGALTTALQPVINFLISGLELAFDKFKESISGSVLGRMMGLGGFTARSFDEIQAGRQDLGGAKLFEDSSKELANVFKSFTSELNKTIEPFLSKVPDLAIKTATGITPEGREGLLGPVPRSDAGARRAMEEAVQGEASSLRRIGGGGGAFFADPLIKEAQSQTQLLRSIDRKLGGDKGALASERKSVYLS